MHLTKKQKTARFHFSGQHHLLPFTQVAGQILTSNLDSAILSPDCISVCMHTHNTHMPHAHKKMHAFQHSFKLFQGTAAGSAPPRDKARIKQQRWAVVCWYEEGGGQAWPMQQSLFEDLVETKKDENLFCFSHKQRLQHTPDS